MMKKLSFIIYKILFLFDKILNLISKRSFLIWFKEFLEKDSYKNIKIQNKKITLFTPNQLTSWRVDTFFTKEPETLEWINSFNTKEKTIFWDIGANIGLYSIYNATKNNNSDTISFEPSTSNLRVLSRNISINNLENKIKIFPMPLTNVQNKFLLMNEGNFIEGGALNAFGEKFDFEGKEFNSKMKYTLFGTNIKYLLENNILETPNYIKIDVDGIEHLILKGAGKFLSDPKIMSLSVEINENFKDQYKNIIKILEEAKFKILQKKRNEEFIVTGSKFENTYNYIFTR
jgi:FkbM family methyltransferase